MPFQIGLQSKEKPEAIRYGTWQFPVCTSSLESTSCTPIPPTGGQQTSTRTDLGKLGSFMSENIYLNKVGVGHHLSLLKMLEFSSTELLPCARPCGCARGYGKGERNLMSLSLKCLQSKRRIKWDVNYETIIRCSTDIHRSAAVLVWTWNRYWEPGSVVSHWHMEPAHAECPHVYASPLSDGPEGDIGNEALKVTSKPSKHRMLVLDGPLEFMVHSIPRTMEKLRRSMLRSSFPKVHAKRNSFPKVMGRNVFPPSTTIILQYQSTIYDEVLTIWQRNIYNAGIGGIWLVHLLWSQRVDQSDSACEQLLHLEKHVWIQKLSKLCDKKSRPCYDRTLCD